MNEIVLYSTGCPKCTVLEKKLTDKGISYAINRDVDEMINIGIESIPVLKVDGELLNFADAIKWVNEQ